jgi:hypothetical protein
VLKLRLSDYSKTAISLTFCDLVLGEERARARVIATDLQESLIQAFLGLLLRNLRQKLTLRDT